MNYEQSQKENTNNLVKTLILFSFVGYNKHIITQITFNQKQKIMSKHHQKSAEKIAEQTPKASEVQNENLENQSNENASETEGNENASETESSADNSIGDDLEDSATPSKHVVDENTPKFTEREWLENNNPLEFINETTASSKYDATRETKIHDGITIIGSITLGGNTVNPLLLLLGRWWEVKPARQEIKKMIDAEAAVKGFPADVYMQLELGKEVDALAEMQSAIDRIRYAKTYFKPRNRELSNTVITKPLQIDGVIYDVPVKELEAAKVQYADNKEELKTYILSVSKKREVEIETL
jgi:hypothetical protein